MVKLGFRSFFLRHSKYAYSPPLTFDGSMKGHVDLVQIIISYP
jgi:hypothetical protein